MKTQYVTLANSIVVGPSSPEYHVQSVHNNYDDAKDKILKEVQIVFDALLDGQDFTVQITTKRGEVFLNKLESVIQADPEDAQKGDQ